MDNNNQGELKLSIHSLRAGSAISKVLEGQSLRKVMYDAYWKNPATAWKYLKLYQVYSLSKTLAFSFLPCYQRITLCITQPL